VIAESEVQEAVYALLTANTTLAGIVSGIYDLNNIPPTATFPHVVLGETTMAPFNVFGAPGQNITLAIHTWSKYSGKQQLATIRGALYDTLNGPDNGVDLSMPHYSGTIAFDAGNAMSDDSTSIKLMHGTDRYRIRVREMINV